MNKYLALILIISLSSCQLFDSAVKTSEEIYNDGKNSIENIKNEYEEVKSEVVEIHNEVKEIKTKFNTFEEEYLDLNI